MKKTLKALTLAAMFHLSLGHDNHVHVHEEHKNERKASVAISR